MDDAQRLEALFTDPNYTRKKVELSDGRILSYAEAGNLESPRGGPPILFQFGMMGSSMLAVLFHEELLARDLRLIAVDYPGKGESTPMPHRAVADWAVDMREFCDRVLVGSGSAGSGDHDQIVLFSHSMGAPHALAMLADPVLGPRVAQVTLASPWVLFDDHSRQHNPWYIRAVRRLPPVFANSIVPSVLIGTTTSSLLVFGSVAYWSSQAEGVAIHHVTGYAKHQGSAGSKQMVRMAVTEPAPMVPANSKAPISIFHGSKDGLISSASCEEFARQLRSSGCHDVTLTSVEGAGHDDIMFEENLRPILDSLVVTESNEE